MPNALGLLADPRGEMRATPRNKLMGLLADYASQANQFATKNDPRYADKRQNQTLGLLADAVSLGSVAKTLDRLSYGEPLTNKGKANVPFLKPETADVAMMAPLSPRNALAALGMVGGMADNGAMKAATVWHGSPHKFDKFDASKIGTGEGAQAYGHGLYLAESDNVAKTYRDALSTGELRVKGGGEYDPKNPLHLAAAELLEAERNGMDKFGLAQQLRAKEKAYRARNTEWAENAANETQAVWQSLFNAKLPALEEVSHGNLYKVDLPDDQIARMLDYDKPLSEQAPAVQEALNRAGLYDGAARNVSGNVLQDITAYISKRDGRITTKLKKDQMAAAEALRQAGIPGIRYLDGGSRGAGQGSSNFVVFPQNEGLLTILERNGQPIK